jgi:hypothetical protein
MKTVHSLGRKTVHSLEWKTQIKDQLEDLREDGRILLKYVLKNTDGRVQTGFA